MSRNTTFATKRSGRSASRGMEQLEGRRLLSAILGSADTFAALATTTVTNVGATVLNGNLGVTPGTSITGFGPGIVTAPGQIHNNDPTAIQAEADAATAYGNLSGLTETTNLTGQDLGGMTLTPGVYKFNTSAGLSATSTLTLDAQNNPNAMFVFQIGSTLTTGSTSIVRIINAPAHFTNVFWQVGSSATIGNMSQFSGSLLAGISISMGTGAVITEGNAIALDGAVTLLGNTITTDPTPPPTPGTTLQVIVGHNFSSFATFTAANGAPQTFVVKGNGTAIVNFTGTNLVGSALPGNGKLITGDNIAISSISFSGSTSDSALSFNSGSAAAVVPLGDVTVDGPLGAITGNIDLSGNVVIAGALGKLRIAALNGGTFSATAIGSISDLHDLSGTVNTPGGIGNIAVGGNLTGDISAAMATNLKVTGNVTGSTITLGQRRIRHAYNLGEVIVGGTIQNSTINSRGNLGVITADTLIGDNFYAGVTPLQANTGHLPTTAGELTGDATIDGIMTDHTTDTNVAAFNVGNLALGVVQMTNGGVPFGVAGADLAGISGTVLATGRKFKLGMLATEADALAGIAQQRLNGTGVDFDVSVV